MLKIPYFVKLTERKFIKIKITTPVGFLRNVVSLKTRGVVICFFEALVYIFSSEIVTFSPLIFATSS